MSVSGATSSRFEIFRFLLRYATWGPFPLGHVTFFSLFWLWDRVWLWSVTEAETKNGRVKRAPPVAPKFQTRRKSRRGSLKTTAILLYDSRPIPWELKHFTKSIWKDSLDFHFLKNFNVIINRLFQDCLVNFLIFMEEDASNGIMPLGTDAQTNTVQAQGQTKDRG